MSSSVYGHVVNRSHLSKVPNHTIVTADWLRGRGIGVYDKHGMPPDDAATAIECLVDTDLRGVHSHGMMRLPIYTERLAKGGANPTPDLRIVAETPATAVVDGDAALGMVVSKRCMEIAIEKAREVGVGIVGARNSDHFGACAHWAEMALAHDMIGIVTTNGGNIMAPWGGLTRTFGNDPLGVAVPAGKEWPIVLDMATSVAAGGKFDVAMRKGEKIPFGWAVDAKGNPTDDPKVARAGLVLPVGEHKGYGLTVIFEILAGVLTGANYSRHIPKGDPDVSRDVGHYFQAISIEAFMGAAKFKARVDDLVSMVKSSELAPGFDRIVLPGEFEHEKRALYSKDGIPMITNVIEELRELAERSGVAVPDVP